MKRYTEQEMVEFANFAKNWMSPRKVPKAFEKWQTLFPDKGRDDGYYMGVDMAREGTKDQSASWPEFPGDRVEVH